MREGPGTAFYRWRYRVKRFNKVWKRLSSQGSCDTIGGSEYWRVLREWILSNKAEPIEEFISRRANIGPESEFQDRIINPVHENHHVPQVSQYR